MIKLLFTSIGVVIGDTVVSEKGLLIVSEPRIMHFNKEAETIDMIKMLGEPKELTLNLGVMNYDVTDENLLRRYNSSISGLTIVKTPVEVQGMN